MLTKRIGLICRNHRREVVNLSLKEMGIKTDTYFKTLSAFECGRSTNINHLNKYFNIGTEEQNEELAIKISNVLKGV